MPKLTRDRLRQIIKEEKAKMQKEQKLRRVIRKEMERALEESEKAEKRLDEVAGGPWENVREILRMASQKGLAQDIGTKRDDGDKVHEFAVGGRVFQIKELD